MIDRSGKWKSAPLYKAGRAKATLERAERAIDGLGRGKDFLIVYYGSDRVGGWQRLDRPLRTLTTLDRFGLVQWKAGVPTLRMLQVPELRSAMGLPVTFSLNHGTRRDKVKLLGNGVAAKDRVDLFKKLDVGGKSLHDVSNAGLGLGNRQVAAFRRGCLDTGAL